MAYAVDWIAKSIVIPVSDLTLVSGTRYQLDMAAFLAECRRLEWAFADGLWAESILNHVDAQLDFAGSDYAAFDKVVNGYSVQFSAPATRVDLVGSNNNIIDVFIVNGISVVPSNSAGLQKVTVDGGGLPTEQATQIAEIHGQIRRGVFINTEKAVNGNGYQQTPFNNWTDGVDYAEHPDNNLLDLYVAADATVDRQLKNFTIEGLGLPAIDLNDHIMDGTIFKLVELTGGYSGWLNAIECSVNNLSGMNGVFFTVNAYGTLTVAPDGNLTIWNVKQALAGVGWGLDMNTGSTSKAAIHEAIGSVTVINMDNISDRLEYNGEGDITISSSCLEGNIILTGDLEVIDNSGPNCIVDKSKISSELLMDAIA